MTRYVGSHYEGFIHATLVMSSVTPWKGSAVARHPRPVSASQATQPSTQRDRHYEPALRWIRSDMACGFGIVAANGTQPVVVNQAAAA